MNYFKRQLLAIFAVLAATFITPSKSEGASLITATITITNTAGVGTNWIVNGNTRTWTNAAGTPPASWILTGANSNNVATNLYNSIIRYPYTSPFLTVARTSSNQFTLRGITLVITTNNYFSVSYVTNTGTNIQLVYVPFENMDYATNRTNQAHWLVDGLNQFVRTNAFATNANVVSNLLVKGASPYQVILGPVGFWGRFSALSNFFATNGFTKSLTNIDSVSSNHVNYGNAIRSEGSGGNSLQVGSNALAKGVFNTAIGNSALASNDNALAIGYSAKATNNEATAIGSSAIAGGQETVAIGLNASSTGNGSVVIGAGANSAKLNIVAVGNTATTSGDNSVAVGNESVAGDSAVSVGKSATTQTTTNTVALGASATVTHNNSAAIGPPDHLGNAVATTDTNQIRIGTANHNVVIPGRLYVLGTSIHDARLAGTNVVNGSISYVRYNLTSLANGNNISVPVGTNRFVRFAGTVTAAPTVCGMIGAETAGGPNGQDLLVHNDLGYSCTFAVNTVDPVAANRIETYDGSDVTVANNGWAYFIYSTADSRWHLTSYYPLTATATNGLGVYVVKTNGTVVSSAATNLNLIFRTNVFGLATNAAGNVDVELSVIPDTTKQNGSAPLTNLANNPFVAYTNPVTKVTQVVSGAGNGNTNYLITLSTNSINDFYLGSSNVHLYTVAGSTLGSPIYWNAYITNLSANTWGINFSSGTNRWRFSGTYGTNAPTVLTNNTCLMLSGRSDGTNTLVGFTYFAPGL